MRRHGRLLVGVLCLGLAAVILLSQIVMLPGMAPIYTAIGPMGTNKYSVEKTDGSYYTMVNEKGRVLMYTGLPVLPGDEFIAEDNSLYRVTRVKGDIAHAKFVSRENISWKESGTVQGSSGKGTGLAGEVPAISLPGPLKGTKTGRAFIGIFHTHTDESYIPSDGSDSIFGKGGILKVGTSLNDKLQNIGVKSTQSLQVHCPHDAAAYDRSRRTALQLMKLRPIALIDVHRDAGPAQSYLRRVRNQKVTGIRIVVGRRNPHFGANLRFAKKVKAVIDKTHPGLSAGIFIAHADYNQDLSAQTMLIEVGTEQNRREEAERGVALFADAIPKAMGITPTAAAKAAPQQTVARTPATDSANRSALSFAGWFLVALVAAGAIYLWINAGSWEKAVKRVRNFTEREFGLAKAARKPGQDDSRGDQEQKPEDQQ